MNVFIQQLADGITSGALYGALALALVLVYRASGIVNFAQAELATFAAFFAWQMSAWGSPLIVSIVASLAVAFVVGAAIERVLIRPLADAPTHLPLIIVTLGLMLAITSMDGWIWGYVTKDVQPLFGSGRFALATASVSWQAGGTVLAVAVVSVGLFIVFQRTHLGLMMRAAATNPESARLSGVPVQRMLLIGWGIAAAVGALAGSLAAPQLFLEPNLMAPVLLYAFAAATVGGFDSPVGAVLGGLIIGVAQNLVGTYIDFIGQQFASSVALILILVTLSIKPEGLLGKKKVARV